MSENGEAENLAWPDIGARLARARAAAGHDVASVASELHLRVEVIEALEAGDAERLPAVAFVRGYVRAYARFVGLDGEDLVARLPQVTEHRPSLPRRTVIARRLPSLPLGRVLMFALAGIVLVLVVVYLLPAVERLWQARQTGPVDNTLSLPMPGDEAGQSQAPTGESGPRGDALALPPAMEPAPQATADIPAGDVPPAPSVVGPRDSERATTARPPEQATPSAERRLTDAGPAPGELELGFSADSWLEVRAGGRKLLAGMQRAGSSRRLRATPPVELLIGNAPGTQLSWRGKRVDLAPLQRGNVARVTLND
ncbi:MAG TPA: DUF4115 domain-containing protein [Gammaproteobacteria bacterium]|nr:DUF4115 domain-containing protein [Gammaproteobacteria bacterium]